MSWTIILLGGLIFGIWIFGMSLFVEWAIIKRVMNDPAKGGIASIILSFLINIAIGTGYSGFSFEYAGVLCFGLFTALILSIPGYRKIRKRQNQTSQNLTDTFD